MIRSFYRTFTIIASLVSHRTGFLMANLALLLHAISSWPSLTPGRAAQPKWPYSLRVIALSCIPSLKGPLPLTMV